jgi:hypothetical protein
MRVVSTVLTLLLLAAVDTASAATLIFFDNQATNPNLNQGIAFNLELRADGAVTGELTRGAYPIAGTTRSDLHTFGDNAFGINLADGVTATVRPNPFFPPWTFESDLAVGPYGLFDIVFDGTPSDTLQMLIFTQAGGFTSVLDPFQANGEGLIMGIRVRSSQTGETGFLAADAELNPALVPEPGSMVLLGTGLLAAFRAARKRQPRQGT